MAVVAILRDATLESEVSDDYFEPVNFQAKNEVGERKVTICEPLKTNRNYRRCRKSSYSTFIDGIHQFDPYQELTATQIAAFRQVFDAVDDDGDGKIDAEELYNSMNDLESNLNLDEIKEILHELDRDGIGKIDFEEFLYMMTSMSMQVKEAQAEDVSCFRTGKRRQSVFFSVITKFAMKHSLTEIERYYASKSKNPHVVGHYAAGARVDGLSEKELRQTWKNLSLASKGKDSPYAQPLNFFMSSNHGQRLKKKPIRLKGKKKLNESKHVPLSQKCCSSRSNVSPTFVCPAKDISTKGSLSRPESKVGWSPCHRLPITKIGLPVVRFDRNKKFTMFDMNKIRGRIDIARNSYYNKLNIENEEKTVKYLQALKIDEIPSKRLQENFKKVFRAYSPTAEYENHIVQCPYGKVTPRKNKKNFEIRLTL